MFKFNNFLSLFYFLISWKIGRYFLQINWTHLFESVQGCFYSWFFQILFFLSFYFFKLTFCQNSFFIIRKLIRSFWFTWYFFFFLSLIFGRGWLISLRQNFLRLCIFQAKGISSSLDKLFPLLKFSIVFTFIDKSTLLIFIIFLLSKDNKSLGYFIHIKFCRSDKFKKYILIFCFISFMFEMHGRFQDEGIEVFAKLKMFSKEGVSEKTAVK